jgi:hypothetical protein
VEIAIYNYAPKPEQEEVRQAMVQFAKGIQKAIIAGSKNDVNESLRVRKEDAGSVPCLIKKSPDMLESKTQLTRVQGFVANTNDRVSAYLNYNKALSGHIFSAEGAEAIPCDSDREKEQTAQAAFNAKPFNVQSAYNLPPDPGEAGKATIEGIDSNNNGIRDDVEIAIYNYAPRPDQEELRAALMQYAKVIQRKLVTSPSDQNVVAETFSYQLRASECISLKSVRIDRMEVDLVKKAVLNTSQRDKVDDLFQEKVRSAKTIRSIADDPIPCDYDKAKR